MKCKYWNETLLGIRIDEPYKILVRSFSLEADRQFILAVSPFKMSRTVLQNSLRLLSLEIRRPTLERNSNKYGKTIVTEIKRLHACLRKNTHRLAPRVFHELSNFRKTRRLRGRKEVERRERERERAGERAEGDAECIANVPRVPILKTTPEGIQKPCERGEARFQGERIRQGDRDRARERNTVIIFEPSNLRVKRAMPAVMRESRVT